MFLATLAAPAAIVVCAVACNALIGNDDGVFVAVEGGPNPNLPDSFSPIPGCEKTPSEDPSVLQDKCGIFVFKGAGLDTQPGTRNQPVATIQRAVSLAVAHQSYRVYVCNAQYEENVAIAGRPPSAGRGDSIESMEGVSIIGGLTCAQFQWAHAPDTRAVIVSKNSDFALTIRDITRPMLVEDMEIRGHRNANGAVFVYGDPDAGAPALVRFSRCVIQAEQGDSKGNQNRTDSYPDAAAFQGNDATGSTGGEAQDCNCGLGVTTRGGRGGNSASSGQPGQPGATPGGNGTTGSCQDGTAGATGQVGAVGPGAVKLGTFSQSGFLPGEGSDGQTGAVGAGGGGGGGVSGGGGGGGGCGGCGGLGGGRGYGGGASFAIGAAWSNVAVVGGQLNAADGGNAGSGAPGNPGMKGGDGGAGANGGCRGGGGGTGGAGGAGGGGAGGISAGILWAGRAPAVDPSTRIVVGNPGGAGTGGIAGVAGPVVELK